jgi:drug/metabolite transporter (DMT)-like permease
MASTSIAPRHWSSLSARQARREAGLSRRQAFVLVLLAACLWGTLGTAYHLLRGVAEVDALTVVALRASAGAAILWGWLALTDRAALRVARADLPRLIGFGVGSLGLMYFALFTAFDLTSVAVGTVLLYLAPALVTVGAALFLNEPLTRRKLIALIATFSGCLLVVELYRPQNLVGNAFGIGCGLVAAAAYGAYSLGAKPLLARYRAVTVLAYALLPAAVGLLAVKLLTAPEAWPSPGGLLAIGAYGGIVVTIAPYGLYTLALRRLPSSEASIVATLEPAVAVVLAGTLLGERLAPLQLLGTVGILGGVVLLAWPAGTAEALSPVRSKLGMITGTVCWWRQRLAASLNGRPA